MLHFLGKLMISKVVSNIKRKKEKQTPKKRLEESLVDVNDRKHVKSINAKRKNNGLILTQKKSYNF